MTTLELPQDVELVETLSTSDRSAVLRVERDGHSFVLRIGAEDQAAPLELSLAARLTHRALVVPTEWGRLPSGRPYVLRPFVEGQPFDEAVAAATPEEVETWVIDLLQALAELHEAGLVHRDLKAANVIVGEGGPVLIDLDLLVRRSSTGEGAGSALHIAPEVLLGHAPTPAADLFSLGVMVALAFGGASHEDFHRRFPMNSFWSAIGWEPTVVPGDLGALVRQLVRRHPSDRPVSAREAVRRLQGDASAPPDLRLPFLAGREAALRRLTADLEPVAGERHGVLVTVADAEELEQLLDHVELTMAIGGRTFARPLIAEPLDRSLDELGALDADGALVNGVSVAEQQGVGAATDVLVSFLSTPGGRGASLCLAASPELARDVTSELNRRKLEQGLGAAKVLAWPRLPVTALAEHVDRLTGGSSPDAARALASSLHEQTQGRRADVNLALERAVEAGVLRSDGSSYTLLRTEWPDRFAPDPELDLDPSEWDQPSLSVLQALALASCPLNEAQVRDMTGMADQDLALALATLRERGVLRPERRCVQLEIADARWPAAARRGLSPEQEHDLHARALAVLESAGGPPVAVATHRLAVATTSEEFEQVLALAEELLDEGLHAGSRRLFQRLVQRCEEFLPDGSDRMVVLEARLELAQGDAVRALERLTRAYGQRLDDAPSSVLLVAAHAAEQSGRREEARRLNELVLEREPTREGRLRALVGLAYSDYLDGDSEGALARTADVLQDGDPPEPAATLLNLRGVALTRLGRHDEAAAELARAHEVAHSVSLPLLQARTALNQALLDRRRGLPGAAVDALERAADAFSQAGHVQGRALALNNLGVLQRDRGELAKARALLGQALALRRRVGDVHGAASSLGSLAVLELEAGQVGAALATFERARQLFAEGEYEAEVAFLDIQQAVALSYVGHHGEAASMLSGARVQRARAEHPALVQRAEAALHLASDQRPRALSSLRAAIDLAQEAQDAAELFRAGALLLSIEPGEPDAVATLEEAAEQLDAPVRQAEAAWRSLTDAAPADRSQLESWLATFEEAGRTDLVRAVARRLAEVCDQEGDHAGRRGASARAAEAADALTDGLPMGERDSALERLARGSGPRPSQERQGTSLGIDWLLSCNRRMATEQDLDALLLSIVDMALEVTGSQRGFLVLLEGDQVAVQVARHMDRQNTPEEEVRFSRSVVQETLRTREPVLTTDAAADARFAGAGSIQSLKLRCVLCVPVLSADGVIAALYLDHDGKRSVLDETDVERVRALADQASVAILGQRRLAEIEALNTRLSERVEYQEQELVKTRSALRRRGQVAPVGDLVGSSEAMARVYALIDRVAPTDLSVLVTGPSGSGKDLVARALHERSQRAVGPLVVENVAAVPASLLESELFGHVRGAFTGADRDRPGLFAEADGGTFVLDEIGELPVELQPKLLRVLETGEIRPLGSRRVARVDVRIVAATNKSLLDRVREGEFREDLYYRLNGIEIQMPPLAERLDDIPLLAEHFLARLNEKHGTSKQLGDAVMAVLVRRPWPGQVRELSNEMGRLYFLSDETIDDPELVRPAASSEGESTDPMPASLLLEDVERAAIQRALRTAGQRKDQAARLLGISRAGLYAKIRRLGLGADSAG